MENLSSLTKVIEFRCKLYPKDFYKVKDFYENILQYPIIESWDGENNKGVMFNTGAAVLELLSPVGEYQPLQGTSLSLKIQNVWALWEKFKNNPSIVIVKPLNVSPWNDAGFCIADPEGFKITFFTPNTQKPVPA